jgi:cellulose synthase (UDP-forming)
MNYGIKGFFMHQGAELLLMFTVTSSFLTYILRRKRPFTVTPKGVAGTYSFSQAMPMILVELLVTSTISLGIIWLKTASLYILRVAIYINIFFAFYLIPFLIAASVILFTSTYSPKNETILLTKVQPP